MFGQYIKLELCVTTHIKAMFGEHFMEFNEKFLNLQFFGQHLRHTCFEKTFSKLPFYQNRYFKVLFFPDIDISKYVHAVLLTVALSNKTPCKCSELETRVSSNPEVGDLLVCRFFENENLGPSGSVRLQSHPGFLFPLLKSTERQYQLGF